MKKEKELKKLKEGEEVFFLLNGRQIMEKVKVESIDKKNGSAMLSNRVKVARTLGPDDSYSRLDGGDGRILPITEENENKFLEFKAYYSVKRYLEFISNELKEMNKPINLVDLDKKLSKLLNKYFKK